MEMYKIVRLSVFAWITILLFMLMLDTIGMNIFFPSRFSHVYAKSVAGPVGDVPAAFKSKFSRLQPEKKIVDGDASEEFEDEGDDELEQVEDLCREIVCPSDQYCYIPKPGVAQCYKKSSAKTIKELDDQEDLEDDSSSESSPEEDFDETRKPTKKPRTQLASDSYNHSRIVHCPACPIGKGHMLCGTDNSTYSSMCRLEFHNCIHGTQVKFSCFGYCPCMKVYEKVMLPPSQAKSKAIRKQENALKAEYYNGREDKTMHIQLKKDAPRANEREQNQALSKAELAKLYYRIDKNVPHKKPKNVPAKAKKPKTNSNTLKARKSLQQECGHEQLRSMGLRLLDWFAVVMGEEMKLAKKKMTKNKNTTSYKHKDSVLSNLSPNKLLPNCERPVSFMFHHFDVNNDYRLSMKELYYLEHDEGEHCLEPYLVGCDEDGNGYLTAYEWCSCFNLRLQPCTYRVKHEWKVPPPLGAFVPQCTSSGQYRAVQCHASVGLCWCVDSQGNEIAGTRVRGRYPTCEKPNPTLNSGEKKTRPYPVDEFEDDEDIELEESLEEGRGSGHFEGPSF